MDDGSRPEDTVGAAESPTAGGDGRASEGDPSAVARLDRRFGASTRREAAEALGTPSSSMRADAGRVVEALFEAALSDPDEAVRAAAIESLYFHDDDHVDRLARRIARRQSGTGEDGIREAERGAAETFSRWLDHDRAAYRMLGTTGLSAVGDSGDASRLRGAFDDGDPRVQARAVRGYARVGGEAVGAVRPLIRTPNDLVRRAVVDALVAMDTDDAAALLTLASRRGNERLRLTVARRVGKLDRHEAVDALLDRLGDPSEAVRRAAAASVAGAAAAPESVPAGVVRDRLTADRSLDRDAALAALRAAAAGDAPTAVGSDRSPPETRRCAAWLCCELVEAADSTATELEPLVEWLVETLDADDPLVADLAAAYLPRIASSRAGRGDEGADRGDAGAAPTEALGVDIEAELRALTADETTSEAGRERARAVRRRIKREAAEAAAAQHVEYVYVRWPADYTEKRGE